MKTEPDTLPAEEPTPKPKSKRGFASMSREKHLEIARKGGASVPSHKRSFSQDRELASTSGRTGGKVRARKAAS